MLPLIVGAIDTPDSSEGKQDDDAGVDQGDSTGDAEAPDPKVTAGAQADIELESASTVVPPADYVVGGNGQNRSAGGGVS